MALIHISYCNASLGKTVSFDYDETTHVISNPVNSGASCTISGSPSGYAGYVLYSHIIGTVEYFVRAQNSSPYGYVTSLTTIACGIVINSVGLTNSASDVSNDGIINIVATGNGTVSYSINGGLTYQSSGSFSGLAPGVYNIRVRNVMGDLSTVCFATQTVIVGYNSIAVCDLAVGNVSVTPGPGGTLRIVDYVTTHYDQPVQYRLDAGAWQDSNLFTGLANGTYSVQIRYKNFTTCSAARSVALSACTIVLASVDIIHEQAKNTNNGIATITATSANGPITYSKDNGTSYQAGNVFYNLAPGTYTFRVKDALNCQAFLTVNVLRYKAPVAVFPIANSNRVVVMSGPPRDNGVQNFDNRLFEKMKFVGKEVSRFYQPLSVSDLIPLQWRSSYASHSVEIFNMSNVSQGLLTAVKTTAYLNRTEALAANFSNYGAGQTMIWFPAGLPSFFEVGQPLVISGEATLNGSYTVNDIVAGTGAAIGNICLLITKNYTAGSDPVTGTVTVTYDIENFDVWQVLFDWSAFAAGQYYFKVTGTDPQLATFTAQSEPIETLTDVSELVCIKYKNNDNGFLIDSSTGIEHLLRIEGELVPADPGGESEVMSDSRRKIIRVRGYVTRMVDLMGFALPYYVIEKLKCALIHDTLKCNDIEYQPPESGKAEYPSVTEVLGNIAVRLQQSEFQNENSDDGGDVDGIVLDLDSGNILAIDP